MRVVRTNKRVRFTPRPLNDKTSYMAEVTLQAGEHVLLLGKLDNIEDGIAISTWDGTVLWPVNPNDIEEIT